MSIHSHKSTSKKARAVKAPQRANGKLRVAAILEAAAAVIAEKGYEGATMAEIAARAGDDRTHLSPFSRDVKAVSLRLPARAPHSGRELVYV